MSRVGDEDGNQIPRGGGWGVSLNRLSKILAKTAPQQAKDGAQSRGPVNVRAHRRLWLEERLGQSASCRKGIFGLQTETDRSCMGADFQAREKGECERPRREGGHHILGKVYKAGYVGR